MDECKRLYVGFGLIPEYAKLLVEIELVTATGLEEDIFRNTAENKKFVGKHTLREYFETNRDIW